eukprot:GHVR01064745.1.p1 GENE.GHVR01064745.1~~GHVR01064745.1.p1  ORF type:complete len:420 (-),score=98.01 GHVR01064745.1:332-1591(-)
MNETLKTDRQTLRFESDAGSRRSRWVAGGLAVAIIGWMGSGYILPSESAEPVAKSATPVKAVSVAVRQSQAQQIEQVFVAEGQALPDRDTAIRAEISGQIKEVLVAKGADLEAGQVIARFDTTTRQSDLTRAEEELNRAQREFDNAQALLNRGVSTVDRVAQAQATLAAAQAGVASAQDAIENTEIRAPFAGRLEALDINEGEIVQNASDIGRIVDNTPLSIRIQIPQQSLQDIKVGQTAEVSFITGITSTGTVSFVGTSANAETRTFTADIDVPNADGTIPAGISAQLRIPTGTLTAHFVSPAILSLDTDGTLGIKTVEGANKVTFHEVAIVRAQTDGIWISGLPETAQIITIGQGFVNDGETVDPTIQNDDAKNDDTPAQPPVTAASKAKTPAKGNGQIIGGDVGAAPAGSTQEAKQ